jgi:hypothetical protein
MADCDGRAASGEEMTRGDVLVEKGASRLQQLSQRAARSGGLTAKLAPELADDAAFLRKLKPSLIVARARGRAPTNEKPEETSAPRVLSKPNERRPRGPNPWLVIGAAFALGIVAAKVIDWRSHAHPRG